MLLLTKMTARDCSLPCPCKCFLSTCTGDIMFYYIKTKAGDNNTSYNFGVLQTFFSLDMGIYRPWWTWLIYIGSKVIFRALVAWVTWDTHNSNQYSAMIPSELSMVEWERWGFSLPFGYIFDKWSRLRKTWPENHGQLILSEVRTDSRITRFNTF